MKEKEGPESAQVSSLLTSVAFCAQTAASLQCLLLSFPGWALSAVKAAGVRII